MASVILEQLRAAVQQSKDQSKASPVPDEQMAAILPAVRKGNDDMMDQMYPIPENITMEERTIGGVKGEYYIYDEKDPEKKQDHMMIYIHGGGFENGSVKSRRYAAITLAQECRCDGFSVDYIQWPEGRFEQGFEECLNAYRGILELGYDSKNVYLGGESAGATMILAMTLYLKDHDEKLPGGLALFSPATDLEDTFASREERDAIDPMIASDCGRTMLRHYYDGKDPKHPYHSSRYGNFENFPPAFIGVGTDEILYDDSIDLHEKLDAAGVRNQLAVYEGLYHAFQMIPAPESFESLKQAAVFLEG